MSTMYFLKFARKYEISPILLVKRTVEEKSGDKSE